VPIQISNATLVGTYVFGLANRSTASYSAEVGTISFDGVGDITGGSIDRTGSGGGTTAITGGTYEITTDGRGTAILQTASGPIAWNFVMANQTTGFVARLNADGNASTGSLDLQQSSARTAISGDFAARITGVAASGASPFAQVGSLSANGGSTITRALLDAVTGATPQTNLSGSGSYTAPSSAGRGTLSIATGFGSQSFVYYAVDSTRLKMVETDASDPAYGELYAQPAGPFSTASFNERVAFTSSGFTSSGSYANGGLFTLNGSAGVTNRVLDGSTETVFDTNGIYLVTDAVSGRTTVTWSTSNGATSQYVLYPRAGGGFVMLEIDGATAGSGLALQQTITSPSAVSLAGDLALSLNGTELASSSPVALTGSANISQTGAWTGSLDAIDLSGVTLNAESQTGSFAIASDGRGVVTLLPTSPALSGSTIIIYVLDANNALLLESDSNRVLSGTAVRQF
jgi:hypothetical protein